MRGYFFRHILFAAGLLVPLLVFALAKSIDTAGVWSDTGIWVGGVPGTTSDDVNMINNTGEVIVASDVTVKTMDMGNGNTMTINTGVTFTADNGGLDAFFITNNNTVLNIFGDLIINGNLIINNNLILTVNITGSLIINGDVTINNGGSLDVAGTMDVSGDMTAGTNTSLDVDGSLTIDGTLDTGTGSVVTGSGTVDAGICTGDPAVCNDSQLPIILLYFNATVDEAKRAVKLDWASYEEVNFDHFVLERSSDGLKFSEIGRINGGGWSQDVISYSFLDISPIHGRAYYRLRSVDFDGYEEIFIIKRIDYLQELPVFSVFPNPVTGSKIEVKFSVDPGVYGRLLVFNSVGEKVYTIPLSQGIFSYQIHNITQKGFLYFSVSMSDNIFTQQIWKR